jgi:hypothetical protein
MSTMKRFRPTRSFSTPIGGAGRREAELVFGSRMPAPAARQAGPMVALPGAARPAREPARFDMPSAALDGMRALAAQGLRSVPIERDDTLAPGTMRVTYADGTSEVLPLPKR